MSPVANEPHPAKTNPRRVAPSGPNLEIEGNFLRNVLQQAGLVHSIAESTRTNKMSSKIHKSAIPPWVQNRQFLRRRVCIVGGDQTSAIVCSLYSGVNAFHMLDTNTMKGSVIKAHELGEIQRLQGDKGVFAVQQLNSLSIAQEGERRMHHYPVNGPFWFVTARKMVLMMQEEKATQLSLEIREPTRTPRLIHRFFLYTMRYLKFSISGFVYGDLDSHV
jgi:hypothetical protein